MDSPNIANPSGLLNPGESIYDSFDSFGRRHFLAPTMNSPGNCRDSPRKRCWLVIRGQRLREREITQPVIIPDLVVSRRRPAYRDVAGLCASRTA